jgi:hypothetical protein
MREAERLVDAGVQELLVISQDTSAYGLDLGYARSKWRGEEYEARFLSLAEALGSLGAWVRLHYVYPYPHVDQVLPLMAEGRVLPYLDIPFQHASSSVLKAMRRPAHQEKTLDRISSWRTICPDLAIRSTFIVGFPGETEEDFVFLLEWLSEARLARVGCFKYEDVDGAAANALPSQVSQEVKEERYARLMQHQQAISAEVWPNGSARPSRSSSMKSIPRALLRVPPLTRLRSTGMSTSMARRVCGGGTGARHGRSVRRIRFVGTLARIRRANAGARPRLSVGLQPFVNSRA